MTRTTENMKYAKSVYIYMSHVIVRSHKSLQLVQEMYKQINGIVLSPSFVSYEYFLFKACLGYMLRKHAFSARHI